MEQRIAALRAELEADPASERFTELGDLLIEAGRAREAARLCLTCLGFNPGMARGHLVCGKALVASGDLEEGLRSFERAFSLKAKDVGMYAEAGHCLVDAGKAEYARLYLDKAMALDPDDPRVLDLDSRVGDPLGEDYEEAPTRPYQLGELEAGPGLSAPLDDDSPMDLGDEEEEDEPPTMYMKNPLAAQAVAQMVEDVDAGRPVVDETQFDSEAGLRAEVAHAVDEAVADRGEPPTMFDTGGLAPWDQVEDDFSTEAAGVAGARPVGAEPPTMFDPPLVEQAEPAQSFRPRAERFAEPAPLNDSLVAPSASISYWKVLAVVGPLLLAAILGGIFFGMRHLKSEEINALLEQSLGSVGQDTLLGYGTARNTLQSLLALDAEHVRGRSLMALVCARMHDEYGPNLEMKQEAQGLLQALAGVAFELVDDGLAAEVDLAWARYHLADADARSELADSIAALESRAAADPRMAELAGRLALAAGLVDQARSKLEAGLAKAPAYVRGLHALGDLEQGAGQLERAHEHLVRAVAINGVHTRSLLALARTRISQKRDLERAAEDGAKVLALPQVNDRDRAEAHGLLARLAFMAGKRSEGLSQVKSAADLRSDDGSAQRELARLCLEFYELDEAGARIARLLEMDPEDVEARLMQVAAMLPRGKAGEGLQKLAELEGKKVPAAPFLLLRGQALLDTGRAGAALHDLQQISDKAEEKPRAMALEVLAQLALNESRKANSLALSLQKTHPELGWTHLAMGRVRLDRGLRNAAKAAFAKAVELDPGCYQALVALAGMALEKNRMDQAEDWLSKALASNPYNPQVHLMWGRVKLAKGDATRALASFVRVVREQANSAPALVGMAEALLKMGQLEKAEKAIRKARKFGADSAHDRHVEGRVLMANGKFLSAVRALSAADEAQPRDADILADLGMALLNTHSISKAEKTLKDSLRRKKSPRAQEAMAQLLRQKRKWRDAASAYSLAARYAARAGEPAAEVARLYMEAGRISLKDSKSKDLRYGRARQYFRAAIKVQPEDPQPRFELAAAWDRQEKFAQARVSYQEVLKVDEKHARTLYQLGLLEYADGQDAKAKELLQRYLDAGAKGKRAGRARSILKKLK